MTVRDSVTELYDNRSVIKQLRDLKVDVADVQDAVNMAVADVGDKQWRINTKELVVPIDGWIADEIKVAIPGMTPTALVWVAPKGFADMQEWAIHQVMCVGQENDKLVFVRDSVTMKPFTVNVMYAQKVGE